MADLTALRTQMWGQWRLHLGELVGVLLLQEVDVRLVLVAQRARLLLQLVAQTTQLFLGRRVPNDIIRVTYKFILTANLMSF